MEVFRGSPQDQDFREWFERLRRSRRNRIVAAAVDEILCHKARADLKRISSSDIEEFKTIMIHMATCWDHGCRAMLEEFIKDKLEVS